MDEFEALLGIDIALKAGTIARNTAMPEYIKEVNWIAGNLYEEQSRKERGTRWLRALIFITVLVIMGANHFWIAMIIAFLWWCWIDIRINRQNRMNSSNQAWDIVNEKLNKKATIDEAMYQAAAQRLQIK
jgi:hypothetical protein